MVLIKLGILLCILIYSYWRLDVQIADRDTSISFEFQYSTYMVEMKLGGGGRGGGTVVWTDSFH